MAPSFRGMALSTLSAPAEPVGLFGLVLAGIGVAWNNPPQTLVWPEATRQFKGSNYKTSAVQVAALFLSTISLLFLSLRTDNQPFSMAQMVDGRRIVLHSVIYVETLKACDCLTKP